MFGSVLIAFDESRLRIFMFFLSPIAWMPSFYTRCKKNLMSDRQCKPDFSIAFRMVHAGSVGATFERFAASHFEILTLGRIKLDQMHIWT